MSVLVNKGATTETADSITSTTATSRFHFLKVFINRLDYF